MLWQRLWTLKSYRELLPGEFSFDFTPRHGHVIHISEEEKKDSKKHFQKADNQIFKRELDKKYKSIKEITRKTRQKAGYLLFIKFSLDIKMKTVII